MLDHHLGDGILELRMNRPPVNALDPALVGALRQAIDEAPARGAEGIVLAGTQGMFSAGLDVPALLQLDRQDMRLFWQDFFALAGAIARSPLPIVSAVTGHSPAGGAVLALLSDYRVMAHGPFRIGLNEVQVGLIVPDCIQLALRRVVGRYRAERLLVAGAMLDAEQALETGFVDELVPIEQVVRRARNWMAELLALPRAAMRGTRELARADLAAAFEDPSALPVEAFLDSWFSDATQQVLSAMVARLRDRSG
jgi:Delta3-Delta2-enoyl-CoA isomerase